MRSPQWAQITVSSSAQASQSSSSSSQLNEWRKRATQAEEKVKALSASLVEITNDRDRLLAEQQDAVGGAAGDAGEWKQKSDELEKRVIELTQRNRNYERSVGSMVTRCDAAEKKAKESVEAPADFLRAGFTPQLTEELARALLQLKMELYREDVKNYTFQIKRDGEKIVLIPKYKK